MTSNLLYLGGLVLLAALLWKSLPVWPRLMEWIYANPLAVIIIIMLAGWIYAQGHPGTREQYEIEQGEGTIDHYFG